MDTSLLSMELRVLASENSVLAELLDIERFMALNELFSNGSSTGMRF